MSNFHVLQPPTCSRDPSLSQIYDIPHAVLIQTLTKRPPAPPLCFTATMQPSAAAPSLQRPRRPRPMHPSPPGVPRPPSLSGSVQRSRAAAATVADCGRCNINRQRRRAAGPTRPVRRHRTPPPAVHPPGSTPSANPRAHTLRAFILSTARHRVQGICGHWVAVIFHPGPKPR